MKELKHVECSEWVLKYFPLKTCIECCYSNYNKSKSKETIDEIQRSTCNSCISIEGLYHYENY